MEDALLVAESEAGELLGYALGRPGPSEIPPYQGELVALHVRREDQGQGLGRRLLGAMAQHLQQRGAASLMLWTPKGNPARALYQALGGRLIGEKGWGGNQEYGSDVKEAAYGWADIGTLAALAEAPADR